MKEEPTGQQPWSFCETPEEKCTMNYCDENGCQNRKRHLVEPSNKAPESPNPNGLSAEDKIRIDDHAMAYSYLGINYHTYRCHIYDTKAHAGFKEGAQYATLYEREQSAAKDQRIKELEAREKKLLEVMSTIADEIYESTMYSGYTSWADRLNEAVLNNKP